MQDKLRVAIVGYGNVGRYAVRAIELAPDMVLEGVVRRDPHADQPRELSGVRVVSDIRELPGAEAALLSLPTRAVPENAERILGLGISTVDSYDLHGELADLRLILDRVAKESGATAVISAGWDPGTNSIVRGLFELMTPTGITYTNYGPGMSMGHTVAVKAIAGVQQALSVTIPAGMGVHKRAVYVELAPGAEFAIVEAAIKADPYFVKDETHVFEVQDVTQLIDVGHGVLLERKGASSGAGNQVLKLDIRVNNPALTAQVLVAALRAAARQQPGCYTLLEIPIIDFLPGERDAIVRRLV